MARNVAAQFPPDLEPQYIKATKGINTNQSVHNRPSNKKKKLQSRIKGTFSAGLPFIL